MSLLLLFSGYPKPKIEDKSDGGGGWAGEYDYEPRRKHITNDDKEVVEIIEMILSAGIL